MKGHNPEKRKASRQHRTSTSKLSVVVVILGGRSYICRFLERFTRHAGNKDVEILVPYDDSISDVASLKREFPRVRFLHREGRRSYAELRALGVMESRGAIVAITEDHCTPDPDWCFRILEAHSNPHAAVGGSVDKAGRDTPLNWGIYLLDFGRYMNPVTEGPSPYLTDCNVSYKRSALASIAPVWTNEFHETLVNDTLQGQGGSLWLSPHIVVRQQRSLRVAEAIRERYAFGRLFACTRVAQVTPKKRALYAVLSWLLPPLLVLRALKNVLLKRRNLGKFVRALPAIILLSFTWSLGEFLGYLTDRQRSGRIRRALKTDSGRRATA